MCVKSSLLAIRPFLFPFNLTKRLNLRDTCPRVLFFKSLHRGYVDINVSRCMSQIKVAEYNNWIPMFIETPWICVQTENLQRVTCEFSNHVFAIVSHIHICTLGFHCESNHCNFFFILCKFILFYFPKHFSIKWYCGKKV